MGLIVHGAEVGLNSLTNLNFRSNRPHSACGLCGAVFQSDADRDTGAYFAAHRHLFDSTFEVTVYALGLRKEWSHKHAATHSEREHQQLRASGLTTTPEAAKVLASYGIIALGDAVVSQEHEHALAESNPIPVKDAEDRV